MPTVFRIDGYRGYFFSNEGSPREPIHIHVEKGEGEAKFWVLPSVELAESIGMKIAELKRAESIVKQQRQQILDLWEKHFKLKA